MKCEETIKFKLNRLTFWEIRSLNHFLIREGRYYSHVCVLYREAPALEKGAHLTDLHLIDEVAGSCEVEPIRAIVSSSAPASLAFSSSFLF